ncbi:DUF4435 domain-containing protein [Nostoc sp. 'Peltigera membranacea cyanobiont' N6]|uniref:DUF4435 domain-containing protein n=1 Tax=Nostoc sp. 'Peltigera membranacea cyanobiont' N6 TaxID=1261031 RepID=UPI000CF330CF|nr:DUF4435 domain-containing protein [Nostoc sp. 'Peltigera membranacea cyanobiont' N6]AVH61967.1 hypothetical protein NPM_0081 [Nostoc sp. 'Peltigera membranacea cyanobiont' N6]
MVSSWSKSSKDMFVKSEDIDPISRYKLKLEFSHTIHLLVEGKTDKILFQRLLEEIFDKTNQRLSRDDIFIDSAELLTGFTKVNTRLGNGEKVELFYQQLENESCISKFVGFADREFKDFDISEIIQDKLPEHKVQGRLVWSRGHSIENYFFDVSILRYTLRILSITEWLDDALKTFENLISSTVRLACAVSLASKDLKYIKAVQNSINWQIVEIDDFNVNLRIDDWKQCLIKSQKLNNERVEEIVERYIYWYSIIKTTDFSVIRWVCHGHIGINTIWAVYIRCVYEVCRKKFQVDLANASLDSADIEEIRKEAARKEANKLHEKIQEEIITHICGCHWASKIIGNQFDYPLKVLTLLGIHLP